MAKNNSPKGGGPSVKDDKMYERLRKESNSKEKSARIANAAANSSRKQVGRKGGNAGTYEDWTVPHLRDKAREVGISGRSRMNKGDIIDALRNS